MQMNVKYTIYIIVVIFLAIVSTQNTQVTTLKILFWEMSLSIIALILITTAIGFSAGYISSSLIKRKESKDPGERTNFKDKLPFRKK